MERHPGFDQEKTQGVIPEQLQAKLQAAERAAARDLCNERITGGVGRAYGDDEILKELFSYHPPTVNTLPKFAAINQAAKNFAEIVLQNCPNGADRSAAIRQIREARMTANAAIALNGLSL